MKRTLIRTISILVLCTSGALGAGAASFTGLTVVHAQTAAANVQVCGAAGTYTAPTSSAAGSLVVGGITYKIAAGETVTGASAATNGAAICLGGTFNSSGALTSVTITTNTAAGTPASLVICGPVSAYTAATSSAAGTITINGITYPIASGTTIGGATVAAGLNVCIKGNVGTGGISTANATSNSNPVGTPTAITVNVCGTLSAYTAATGTTPGSIVIAGITFPIATATTISNTPTTGTATCASLTLAGLGGAVSAATFSTGPSPGSAATFSGPYTAYTAATTTTPGTIIIGGVAYSVAAGSTVSVSGGIVLAATLAAGGAHLGHGAALGME